MLQDNAGRSFPIPSFLHKHRPSLPSFLPSFCYLNRKAPEEARIRCLRNNAVRTVVLAKSYESGVFADMKK